MLFFSISALVSGIFNKLEDTLVWVGLMIAGIGTCILFIVNTPFILLAIAILIGIGLGFFYTAAYTKIATGISDSLVFQYSWMYMIASVGFILGAIISGSIQNLMPFSDFCLILGINLFGISLFFMTINLPLVLKKKVKIPSYNIWIQT